MYTFVNLNLFTSVEKVFNRRKKMRMDLTYPEAEKKSKDVQLFSLFYPQAIPRGIVL